MTEFLFEVRSEEIPARMQVDAQKRWKTLGEKLFESNGLVFESLQTFITPRRLVLYVTGLPLQQPDRLETRKGPRLDAPQAALDGFFRSVGQDPTSCQQAIFGKHTHWVIQLTTPGRPMVELLPLICQDMLQIFTWPKTMRWGKTEFSWIRPIQSVLCVLNGKEVPWTFDPGGEPLKAQACTYGHPVASPHSIPVSDFKSYQEGLENAYVILESSQRREQILTGLKKMADGNGLSLFPQDLKEGGLLDEVTGLVEWPVVLEGRIDETFLDLPQDVLTTAMRVHQRYFPLKDLRTNKLSPIFGWVANTVASDGGKTMVAGNERVLKARLSDARFFWEQDRRLNLAEYRERLKQRQLFQGLGTLYDKSERLEQLACFYRPGDVPLKQVAGLCKADLETHMVGEFPELQGIMGMHYARAEGLSEEVAAAFPDHYLPQGNSPLPEGMSLLGQRVGIFDRLDTLVGFFRIGRMPTGSKDPLALRRAASGLVQLVVSCPDPLCLETLIQKAYSLYETLPDQPETSQTISLEETLEKLGGFLKDRLHQLLKERGVAHDIVEAVLQAPGLLQEMQHAYERALFFPDFLKSSSGAQLLMAIRRVLSILSAEEAKDQRAYLPDLFQPSLLTEQPERDLWEAILVIQKRFSQASHWKEKLQALELMVAPTQNFFQALMVNVPEAKVRHNRLALLAHLRALATPLADFSTLEG